MRRQLLVDPHVSKDGSNSPDPVIDNPLSQNPGRFLLYCIFVLYLSQNVAVLAMGILIPFFDFSLQQNFRIPTSFLPMVLEVLLFSRNYSHRYMLSFFSSSHLSFLFLVDSMWGRFFRNAELERMVDQDLTRLYPERGSYFQTSGCQGILRRILLLWCLSHPEYGYRQGRECLLIS